MNIAEYSIRHKVVSWLFTVILLGLGIAYGIHIATRYELVRHQFSDDSAGFTQAVRDSLITVGPGIITGAVALMLLSFSMQVLIVGVEQFVTRFLPEQYQDWGVVLISRAVSGFGLFVAIYLLFYSLTPSKYRRLKR